MFKLFKKSNYFIGVDIGTSTVKIIELAYKDQKPYLENYGWVEMSFLESYKQIQFKSFEEKISASIKALSEKMQLKSKGAYVSIPGFSGLITLIEFPRMETDELEEAIKFEARKHIPTSLDEVFIGWEVISQPELLAKDKKKEAMAEETPGKTSVNNDKMHILLVAAPKDEVAKHEGIVNASGLETKAVELETFAITRALVGEDKGNFLLIDIGSRVCNIVLVEKGIVKVSRSLEAGGDEITKSIVEGMNIAEERADALKKEGKDFINSRETSIVFPTLDLIVNEVKRILYVHKEKNPNMRLDGIILSGGSSKLAGIIPFFEGKLNIKTTIANPWSKIVYDQRLEPKIKQMGQSFSVAIGLALRGIEDHKKGK